jgi:sensor histidine kinase YesM
MRGNLHAMQTTNLWRQFASVQHVIWLLVLTTAAALIVKPYFGYEVPFNMLWLRLFVVAFVMTVTFIVTEAVWRNLPNPRLSLLTTQLISVPVAAFLGTVASGLMLGRTLTQMFTVEPMLLGILVFTTVAIGIGAITAMLLVYRERAARADVESARAASRETVLQKQVLEARLKLMQAQIEPHFLFNTLANVQHLVGKDPALANQVLGSLIRYLRSAMPQMRDDTTTLAREVELARAYLEIQRVRMGERLRFSISVDAGIADTTIPPMMLMTLVENAIKHGIDPAKAGGEITIDAARDGEHVLLRVADSGNGIVPTAAPGVGLQNVRERLSALFGGGASLELRERPEQGVEARLKIPLRQSPPLTEEGR